MPFHISVELLEPLYQATAMDGERAEWPPHPARLFCALVGHADLKDTAHRMALTWLEAQEPPVVTVPARPMEADHPRAAWVVTNIVDPKKVTHGLLPGRTAGGVPRTWAQKTLSGTRMVFSWAAEPGEELAPVLKELVRRVPYFGRSTGAGLLDAWCGPDEPGDEHGGRQRWRPAANGEYPKGSRPIRIPYRGYLAWLEEAFEEQRPSWSQAVTHHYLHPDHADRDEAAVAEGPFGDLLTFSFAPGVALDPRWTLELTGRLRGAVMSTLEAMGHDVPAMTTVHGHKSSPDDPRPVVYLALPFAGHRHADGRLLGLGIALPREMPKHHRKALLDALLHHDGGLRRIRLADGEPLDLERVSPADQDSWPLTVQPWAWQGPSTMWATVLPMVLDRFPKKYEEAAWAESVAASCVAAGLPEPVWVQVSPRSGLVPGARDADRFPVRRKDGERPLPSCHVRLTFPVTVAGPVVLGSKKNFGLGLCRPEPHFQEDNQ
ncbi:type I-U CRISPR-associated protein Csb2 [Streptomyces sp. NRRL S-350]|uniref:type I-G CRISPR-associated protein Csb2 n=1 Tax=Streptomyces sp. NRRL S-350 TaxID=1463902 RepID=UPI0004C27685|nr:type I-U CRISPR-associated protein Csb2 [Streptomyces sp. NRRL S-350]